MHFTETCDADTPHLIVEVTATSATLADGEIVEELHAHLADQQMLLRKHLLDAGYVDTEILAQSQIRYHVDVVGPAMPDLSWASKEAGFTATALNVLRACSWLADGTQISPPASRFVKLVASAKAVAAA